MKFCFQFYLYDLVWLAVRLGWFMYDMLKEAYNGMGESVIIMSVLPVAERVDEIFLLTLNGVWLG